jgi:hypothetical protein
MNEISLLNAYRYPEEAHLTEMAKIMLDNLVALLQSCVTHSVEQTPVMSRKSAEEALVR